MSIRSLPTLTWTLLNLVGPVDSPIMRYDQYSCWTARVLRLLATSHIFREVAPDTFAHNYISSVLDTGKSTEEILAEYVNKLHDPQELMPSPLL